jgi:hypothetical protein
LAPPGGLTPRWLRGGVYRAGGMGTLVPPAMSPCASHIIRRRVSPGTQLRRVASTLRTPPRGGSDLESLRSRLGSLGLARDATAASALSSQDAGLGLRELGVVKDARLVQFGDLLQAGDDIIAGKGRGSLCRGWRGSCGRSLPLQGSMLLGCRFGIHGNGSFSLRAIAVTRRDMVPGWFSRISFRSRPGRDPEP